MLQQLSQAGKQGFPHSCLIGFAHHQAHQAFTQLMLLNRSCYKGLFGSSLSPPTEDMWCNGIRKDTSIPRKRRLVTAGPPVCKAEPQSLPQAGVH